jgi:hypothetical protein
MKHLLEGSTRSVALRSAALAAIVLAAAPASAQRQPPAPTDVVIAGQKQDVVVAARPAATPLAKFWFRTTASFTTNNGAGNGGSRAVISETEPVLLEGIYLSMAAIGGSAGGCFVTVNLTARSVDDRPRHVAPVSP